MDPRYMVYGIWSKIMDIFARFVDFRSVITFSDNRLFTGLVYEKMGFHMDGDVKCDYYWVKNGKRFNKSSMRKPKGHMGTERDLRLSQGYRQIWDYGKIRWKLTA
ncbi:hypothetical protein LCGC14_2214370 [marine sediment metagenome]|uniref:N-acetyltransferase domain-containing protein n=1 Tax=marine sediment metagenome TaxID=412755 RepID=A0A0F9E0B9_9ZZZZ